MRNSIALIGVSILAAVLLLAPGPGPASAAFLAFIEEGDSVIVVHDANFECGIQFTATGEFAHVDACWLTTSPPGYTGASDALMVEPASSPFPGSISDRIHIEFRVDPGPLGFNVAHMVVDFVSDPETAPPVYPPPGVPILVEDGTSQLLNLFFFPLAPPENVEMRAQSDVEPPVPTDRSTWGRLKAQFR